VGIYRRSGKRCLDLVVIAATAWLTVPLAIVAGLLVGLTLGRPLLFVQQRPGLAGRPFAMYKFRTMSEERDAAGRLLPDGERLGAAGRFLRATSLDELPELWNVLKGDMSLVGPRPLLTEYLPLYTAQQARRHEVPPGITGWAQINGRNAISWERKFQYDLWYVEHQSLLLDLRILALTPWRVSRGEGISEPGQATAQPFRGADTDTRA
jgi:sugar transferase EpsL